MGDNNMSFVIIVFELRQKIVGGECMGLVGWIKTNILKRDNNAAEHSSNYVIL